MGLNSTLSICRALTTVPADRELRDRLKRYEAEGVPTDVKQDRLFEIRFFDALPPCVHLHLA